MVGNAIATGVLVVLATLYPTFAAGQLLKGSSSCGAQCVRVERGRGHALLVAGLLYGACLLWCGSIGFVGALSMQLPGEQAGLQWVMLLLSFAAGTICASMASSVVFCGNRGRECGGCAVRV